MDSLSASKLPIRLAIVILVSVSASAAFAQPNPAWGTQDSTVFTLAAADFESKTTRRSPHLQHHDFFRVCVGPPSLASRRAGSGQAFRFLPGPSSSTWSSPSATPIRTLEHRAHLYALEGFEWQCSYGRQHRNSGRRRMFAMDQRLRRRHRRQSLEHLCDQGRAGGSAGDIVFARSASSTASRSVRRRPSRPSTTCRRATRSSSTSRRSMRRGLPLDAAAGTSARTAL